MADIRISHTHEEGTVLTGSAKGDGVWEIARRHGFTYRKSVGIFIMGSRDHLAPTWKIEGAAKALREAGHEVTVEIDNQHRPRAEVLADKAERAEERGERFEDRAHRRMSAADAAHAAAHQISGRFEGGQPILVGHHSERGARRDRDRMEALDRQAGNLADQAGYWANQAQAAGSQVRHGAKPAVTARRIKTAESRVRCIDRDLEGYTRRHLDGNGNVFMIDPHPPATGAWRERLLADRAQLEDQLAYDRAQLQAAIDEGRWTAWGPDNVHVGDLVSYWSTRSGSKVVKVNKVTVSCESGYSWPDKVKFTDIKQVVCPHDEPDDDADPVDDAGPPEEEGRSGSTLAVAGHDGRPVVLVEQRRVELSSAVSDEARAAVKAALAAPEVYAPGFFPTPPAVAARMAAMAVDGIPPNGMVLEPSAGNGSLVKAVVEARPDVTVYAIEPVVELSVVAKKVSAGGATVETSTFEESRIVADRDMDEFDAVVMNPPFSAPGHPVLWAEHVALAYQLLKPGGVLVAIVPASLDFSQDRRAVAVRDLLEHGGCEPLPDDTFAPATQVRSRLMWTRRPAQEPSTVDGSDIQSHGPAPTGSTGLISEGFSGRAFEQTSLLDELVG